VLEAPVVPGTNAGLIGKFVPMKVEAAGLVALAPVNEGGPLGGGGGASGGGAAAALIFACCAASTPPVPGGVNIRVKALIGSPTLAS
jgi:hypothetical protein